MPQPKKRSTSTSTSPKFNEKAIRASREKKREARAVRDSVNAAGKYREAHWGDYVAPRSKDRPYTWEEHISDQRRLERDMRSAGHNAAQKARGKSQSAFSRGGKIATKRKK